VLSFQNWAPNHHPNQISAQIPTFKLFFAKSESLAKCARIQRDGFQEFKEYFQTKRFRPQKPSLEASQLNDARVLEKLSTPRKESLWLQTQPFRACCQKSGA